MDSKPLPLREVKPKNARTKRILETKAPLATENARTTLFLKYTSTSETVNLVLSDLHSLKRPLAVKFNKKNNVHPFEDASSLEFFSEKNDASLVVFGSHSKKRPHCVTLVRLFGYKVLDMLELTVDAEGYRSLQQFKNRKAAVGLKPLISFSGSAWENPVADAYTLAKSVLTDLFKGPDVKNVDVEGLQFMIHFSVDEVVEESVKPAIHMRCYLLRTKKGGSSLPTVEVEEMGPRIDFRVGRIRQADPEMWKESMKLPKSVEVRSISSESIVMQITDMMCALQPKAKKNIDTDIIGDKVGRIHLGRQDFTALQTRKMKGLKRSRDVVDDDDAGLGAEDMDVDGGIAVVDKHVRVEA